MPKKLLTFSSRVNLPLVLRKSYIDLDGRWVIERLRPEISVSTLNEQVQVFRRHADLLFHATQQPDAKQMTQRAEQYLKRLRDAHEENDEIELIVLAEQIRNDSVLLDAIIDREIQDIREQVARLEVVRMPVEDTEALTTTIRAGSLTTAVNQVRLQQEQVLRQWLSTHAAYVEHLAELKRDLSELSISSMQRLQGRVNQLNQQQANLTQQKQITEQAIQQAKAWQLVAELLHSLLESIQRLGEPAVSLLEDLQQTEIQISRAFAANPSETFNNVTIYYQQLRELEQQVNRFAGQAEREFNRMQDQYRQLLIQRTGITPASLWPKIFYSSTNTAGVYQNLYEAVDRQISDVLDGIGSRIEQHRDVLLRNSVGQQLPEIDLQKIDQVTSYLDKFNNKYTTLTEQATTGLVRDFEQFSGWLDDLEAINNGLMKVQQSLSQLREQPSPSSLSSGQQALSAAITRMGTSSLIRVRQELADLGDDEFWKIVRESWEQQIIEVQLQILDE